MEIYLLKKFYHNVNGLTIHSIILLLNDISISLQWTVSGLFIHKFFDNMQYFLVISTPNKDGMGVCINNIFHTILIPFYNGFYKVIC